MDTNVFISKLKSDDPYHRAANSIVRALEKREIQAETSVLTLLETASVLSRLYRAKKSGEEKRKVFIVKTLKRLSGLAKFVNIAGDAPIPIKGMNASLPSIFNEAIVLSLQCNLRTLDLIHLAAARHGKRMNGELGAFVTGDGGFLSEKRGLSEVINMPILSPNEYASGLGI